MEEEEEEDPLMGALETELHHAPSTVLVSGDYAPVHNIEDIKVLFWVESPKLWGIAGPIAFNILCNYGVNSFTNIFVGHIGNVELSAVALSLSVIANFSFGFLVSTFHLFIVCICIANCSTNQVFLWEKIK